MEATTWPTSYFDSRLLSMASCFDNYFMLLLCFPCIHHASKSLKMDDHHAPTRKTS